MERDATGLRLTGMAFSNVLMVRSSCVKMIKVFYIAGHGWFRNTADAILGHERLHNQPMKSDVK